MERTTRLAGTMLKGILSLILAVLSLALLYEVAADYQGRDASVKWVVLVIFPASYLWWMVEQLLRQMGVKRSAGFSLLIAVALSVWLLAVSEKLNLADRAGSLVETVWGWLETGVYAMMRRIP